MFNNNPRIGQELLDVPMGQMIEQMAMSIAKAQMALDSNSIEVAEMMGGLSPVKSTIKDANGNEQEFINFKDSRVFFGKEKVQTSDAVDLYNTNTDQAYRAAIMAKLNTNDLEDGYSRPVVNIDGNPNATSLPNFTPDNQQNPEVFYRDTVNTKWYEFRGDTYFELDDSKTPLKDKEPKIVAGKKMKKPEKPEKNIFLPQRLSMLELGFSPTFYQFVENTIRVAISIKFTREGSSSFSYKRDSKSTDRSASFSWRKGLKTNKTVTTTQVNAGFSQKFSYSAEGSSVLQTKLVPIPPPAILEERIQQQMEIAREEAEN